MSYHILQEMYLVKQHNHTYFYQQCMCTDNHTHALILHIHHQFTKQLAYIIMYFTNHQSTKSFHNDFTMKRTATKKNNKIPAVQLFLSDLICRLSKLRLCTLHWRVLSELSSMILFLAEVILLNWPVLIGIQFQFVTPTATKPSTIRGKTISSSL